MMVRLQELQAPARQAARAPVEPPETRDTTRGTISNLGLTVETVTSDIGQQLRLPSDVHGVIVTDVVPGGPSWDLVRTSQRGGPDVITAVEGHAVRTDGELRKVLQSQRPGTIITLSIYNVAARNRRVERIKLGE